MTEIPEHLLARSKAARAAKDGGDGDAGGDGGDGGASGGSATPAPAAASTPAPAAATPAPVEEEKPPPPPPPYVQAYERRRRIPYWAMPVLAVLPLWAYVFQGTLEPPPAGEATPEVQGEEEYATLCAQCHGGGGGGGVGPAFVDGALYETWPDWEGQFEWIRLGSSDWPDATYGANDKPVGGGMPGFGEASLSDGELLYVILHERELAGPAPDEAEREQLEAAVEFAFENPEATLEEIMAAIEE